MTKTLLLMRHAKSSWKDSQLADHDRPLSKRGKRDAPRMGEVLRKNRLMPDVIISSSARRARKTAAKVALTSGYAGRVQLAEGLYHGDPQQWMGMLRELPDSHSCVMLIGHNPELEEFLEALTGSAELLPTAAVAQVTLPIDHWQDLSRGDCGVLVAIWRPRDLP